MNEQYAQQVGGPDVEQCANAQPGERERLRQRLDILNQEESCNTMRSALGDIERGVRRLVDCSSPGERREQAILALRHLEDARMRLGKVIQHGSGGGVSVFDGMAAGGLNR